MKLVVAIDERKAEISNAGTDYFVMTFHDFSLPVKQDFV